MTNNFASTNSDVIHAVSTEGDGECIWQDTRDNLVTLFEEDAKFDFSEDDKLDTDSNSSYPSTSIGEMTIYGNGYDIRVILKTVSGYYTGFTLDYQDYITLDFETEDIEDISLLATEVQNELTVLHAYVESIYATQSDQLKVVAQFSNGEAVYEQV